MARGGLSAVRGGRRRTVPAEAALRQLWAAGRGSESCTTARGSFLWGYLGPRRVGRGGSTARCPRRRSWRSQEVLRWARASGNGPVSFSGRRGSRSRGQLELGGSGKESSAAARGESGHGGRQRRVWARGELGSGSARGGEEEQSNLASLGN